VYTFIKSLPGMPLYDVQKHEKVPLRILRKCTHFSTPLAPNPELTVHFYRWLISVGRKCTPGVHHKKGIFNAEYWLYAALSSSWWNINRACFACKHR